MEIGNAPVNDSVTITNYKKRPATFRIELYAWTLNEHHEFKIIPSSPASLDQWMVVNPLRFTIPPGGQQTVRFSIRPRLKPAPGEHRAIMFLVEEPTPGAPATGTPVFMKFGISIYGYVKPVIHSACLQELSFNQSTGVISAHVINSGNVHTRLRGKYAVWKKGQFPGLEATKQVLETLKPGKEPAGYVTSGIIPGNPVLAGGERHYSLKTSLPKQSRDPYVVAIIGEFDGKPLEKVLE
ncbi:molecular chaperone [Chlorobaculum sp. MV4-Y]|uniref:molecular chaperone n=1 Tax=Chlorobaculum sp. MV4-Y TaxID=2976335 RepID=UPI0021AE448B|nr:molecular chaperone [Chlorobaculum sp. MV4-Y]UWX57071.1 molecular chaperone [Chlorobaculum sp. MV4-Y]